MLSPHNTQKPTWHLLFAILITTLMVGCASLKKASNSDTLPIHHVVLVWLNADTSEEQLQATINATWPLNNIDGVHHLKVARALPSDRKLVDDSFSFGITMTFESQEVMQAYLEDPAHIQYLKEHIKGKAEKVVIYDF